MVDISSTQIGSYDTINELRRKVGDWVKEHFREPVRNVETNTLIEFNKDSRRHPVTSLAPGRVADVEEVRLLATLGIPEALAQAHHDQLLPRKPTDAPDVLRIHIFLAHARIDGIDYHLRLLVKEKTGGHYFYDHIVAVA
ncbi:hypothetical protein GCM10028822_20740 [Hymenobacter terrigena]